MECNNNNYSRGKVALITGITGQDGSYLAELLLNKGYVVHGIIRRSSSINTGRIIHLYNNSKIHSEGFIKLHYGDLTDASNLIKLIMDIQPNEIYNLGAQSHVKVSFESASYTADVDGLGVLRVLEAIRSANLEKKTRFYQASSSEMFGKVRDIPQNENTPFYPRSPYAVAKQFGHSIVINYREAYGLHASNGILFNHESPRRGETFVTRKITRGVAKIYLGYLDFIELGNLDSKRDWGHAKDYVDAIWRIMQHDVPDDFVIATGIVHTVRQFVEAAFRYINIDIIWSGSKLNEIGKDAKSGKTCVKINSKLYRPTEVDFLQGDASKAKRILNWSPTYDFDGLIKDMMESDIALMKSNAMADPITDKTLLQYNE